MCNAGDIIVVKNYNDNGKNIDKHSFVVLSDEAGKIQGVPYYGKFRNIFRAYY